MKFERSAPFKPLVITVENKEEFDVIEMIFHILTSDHLDFVDHDGISDGTAMYGHNYRIKIREFSQKFRDGLIEVK